MKASRRGLVAVLCPLLVLGWLVVVQGCGGGGDQGSQAEEVNEEAGGHTEAAAEKAESVKEETEPMAEEAGHYIAGYTCPMHPAASSLNPGNCGTCGMALEKAELQYTCPMCDGVHAHEMGKCPKCGMDLVLRPVKEDEGSKAAH